MAITNYKGERSYEGCVLDLFERNYAYDSYFYAVCWDESKSKVVEIEYDTTAHAGSSDATIDATARAIAKAYRAYFNQCRSDFDERLNVAQAKHVQKGDFVTVVRGRKIPKGTVGQVFWTGSIRNFYSNRTEQRVGIMTDSEEKIYLPLDYVEVVDWESRLLHWKTRKAHIRRSATKMMPAWTRNALSKKCDNS